MPGRKAGAVPFPTERESAAGPEASQDLGNGARWRPGAPPRGERVGKRAVYPGMFDPMHNGHLDLIERSLRIFDELIVAVVANPSKEPLFSVKERLELIDETTAGMRNMRITSFDGLLIDLVSREQADCIVRGIRAVSDFEYEFQMALMNRKLREHGGDGLPDAPRALHVHLVPAHQGGRLARRARDRAGPAARRGAPGREVRAECPRKVGPSPCSPTA